MRVKATDIFKLILFLAVFCFAILINFAVPISYLKKLIKDNKQDLIKLSKLDLEKISNTHKAPTAFENKNFKQTNFEKGLDYYNKKNYKKAVYWLTKSAQQGILEAQYNLGVMYEKGDGVPQNYKQAVYWYTKSAQQGFPQAQNNLGLMYDKGEGVPKNYIHSYAWTNLAVSNNNQQARKGMVSLEKVMTPKQIAAAQELSTKISGTIRKPANQ